MYSILKKLGIQKLLLHENYQKQNSNPVLFEYYTHQIPTVIMQQLIFITHKQGLTMRYCGEFMRISDSCLFSPVFNIPTYIIDVLFIKFSKTREDYETQICCIQCKG